MATCKNVSARAVWGDQQPHILFWDPLYISETNRVRKLKFGPLRVLGPALCKNVPARGGLGRSAAPNFYFGASSISPKLMELRS